MRWGVWGREPPEPPPVIRKPPPPRSSKYIKDCIREVGTTRNNPREPRRVVLHNTWLEEM